MDFMKYMIVHLGPIIFYNIHSIEYKILPSNTNLTPYIGCLFTGSC
jgi:hypothetical protein